MNPEARKAGDCRLYGAEYAHFIENFPLSSLCMSNRFYNFFYKGLFASNSVVLPDLKPLPSLLSDIASPSSDGNWSFSRQYSL